ncbi:MAG: hypothetical protein GYA15_14635 [Leptolinea sp.]|nr:hypothetical protein [Leptolinea sp.]
MISDKLIYDDQGSCACEAVVQNSHTSNKVFVLLNTTSGKTTRYAIDPKWNSSMAFSMKSPKQTFNVDWYTAVFNTDECYWLWHGVKIADYPSLGIRTVKVNFPACGK